MFKVKRLIGILLSVVLVCLLFGGCAKKSVSDEKTLVWMVTSTEKEDNEKVLTEINKILNEKIGVKIKYKYVDSETYDLVLSSSGDEIDLVNAPDYFNYWQNCEKAAFAEITDDDLKKYAPYIWENGQKYLFASNYKGVRYGIPGLYEYYTDMCFAARGDLMDKYGIEDLNSIENVEKYLTAVVENEENMIPFDMQGGQYWWLLNIFGHDWGWAYPGSMNFGSHYYFDIDDPERKLFLAVEQPEMKAFTAKMQEWRNKGFFSRSVLSNKIPVQESFKNGRSALTYVVGGIPACNDLYTSIVDKGHEDWEIRFFSTVQERQRQYNTMNTNVAVARTSKKKELALQVINAFYEDKEIYDLLKLGIKGEHYTIDDEGYYVSLTTGGVSSYAPPAAGIASLEFEAKPKIVFPGAEELKAKLESTHINDPFINCAVSDSNLREIELAITEISNNMTQTRCYGFVDNVDEALKKEADALKKAGINNILESYQKQMDKFGEENKEIIDTAYAANEAKIK